MGRVITAYFSGWLLQKIGSKGVFAFTASFPLLVCLASTLIREDHLQHKASSPPPSLPSSSPPSSSAAAVSAAAGGGGGGRSSAAAVAAMDGGGSSSSSRGSSKDGSGKKGGRRCRKCRTGMAALLVGLLALWGALKQPAILRPALFMFLWQVRRGWVLRVRERRGRGRLGRLGRERLKEGGRTGAGGRRGGEEDRWKEYEGKE
jgi:hypothetical protein